MNRRPTNRLVALLRGALLGTLLLALLGIMGCALPSAGLVSPTSTPERQPPAEVGGNVPAATRAVAGPQPASDSTPVPVQTTASSQVARKGADAPDFALPDLEGNPVSLSSFRGQVVLLNFFATWCPPCNAELPDLIALHHDYQDRGLAIVAIDQGERVTTVAQFVADNEVPFTVLLDANGAVSQQYSVRAIPRSLFIDADGVLVIDHLGYMTDDQMRAYVDGLLE